MNKLKFKKMKNIFYKFISNKFLIDWYETWEYNWLQSYVSKWNPMGIIYSYREVKEERKKENEL